MPAELLWRQELSRRALIVKTIFDGSSQLLQNKSLHPLPSLEIKPTRRQFLKLSGLTTAAAVVWLASGCDSPSASIGSSLGSRPTELPKFLDLFVERQKLSEILVLREDPLSALKEKEKGLYTLGQFAVLGEDTFTFQNFNENKQRQYKMPVKVSGPQMAAFSPDGKQLSIWCRELEGTNNEYTFILDVLEENLRKVDQRVFEAPLINLTWSGNGRWLLVQPLTFGDPSQWPPQESRLFDVESGKIVYAEKSSPADSFSFSPTSQFLVHNSQSRLTVFNLEKRTISYHPSAGWRFSLPTDGRSLVYAKGRQVRIFNLEDLQEETFDFSVNFDSNDSSIFAFSPSGKRLVLLESFFPNIELSVLDLEKRQKTPLPSLLESFISAKTFFKSEQELVLAAVNIKTKNIDIQTVDLEKGAIVDRKIIKPPEGGDFDVYQILNSDYFLGILYSPLPKLDAQLYLSSIKTGKTFLLEGAKFKARRMGDTRSWDIQLSPLSDGSLITANNESCLFQKGLRYAFANPETEKFLESGKTLIKVPQRVGQQIPESVNKLSFCGGDLLLTKGHKEVWYLRNGQNGQRYKVDDLERFQENVQFNRQRYEVPQSLLEGISEGEDPLKGSNNFKDWDGHLIEVHREGSLLILFVQGWNSSSSPSSFREIKAELMRQGHTPGKTAEFSYKVERQANGEIKPLPYGLSETNVVPMLSKQYLEWQIERYKKLFPWSKIVLISHSLGGYLAFRAAFEHMDAIRTVITLDSPLKGIKKTVVGGLNESILRQYWGSQVPQSLLTEAEAVSDEMTEGMALKFKQRGVEIFNFASTGDLVVPHECAFLENSTYELGGVDIRDKLKFYMGRLAGEESLGGLNDNWKDLFIAHGTVIRHPNVIKLIAMILGKIN